MKELIPKLTKIFALLIIMLFVYAPASVLAATNDSANLTRLYGSDRYETAAKIAEAGWPGTSDYAILAPGTDSNLIDALTSGPLAAKLNAPILLTEEGSLNKFAQQELTRLAVKTVYIDITTPSNVNIQNVIQQVKAIATVKDVVVLGGSDISQTSVNIANKLSDLGVKISKAIIVGGSGVDALSVSPIAGTQGIPILYSASDALTGCVSDYLNGIKSGLNKTYIIGGNGVISDAVAAQLPAPVERVAGLDRYETNIQVLKNFAGILKYKSTYLANGSTLVDALSVSPLAAQSGSPILLTSQTLPAASAAYAQANLSPSIVALGGEAVVSPDVLAGLSNQQVIDQDGVSQGSKDSANPESINTGLTITGSNVTLSNSQTDDSITVQGNNAVLNNVTTKGTIFLDPGAKGAALLQNVKAANVVILSGGYSIDLQNVTADGLIIESSSNVYVISSENTSFNQTIAASSANLDNSYGGTFGQMTITNASQSDPTSSVELNGVFSQPITVNYSANITASSTSNIDNLVLAPDNSSQVITLQGLFSNVAVSNPINLQICSNSNVQTLANKTNAGITVQLLGNSSNPTLNVAAASSVSNLDSASQTAGYFGADSGTGSNPLGNEFYIGQLGYGTHEHFDAATGGDDRGGIFFSGNGAAQASNVYGYWLLSGLSMAPSGTTAAEWGQQQAQLAVAAYNEMSKFYGTKAKPVIFVDTEVCGGGLDDQDYANNQAIYTAFVNWVTQNSSAKPGTYSSPNEWNSLAMGSNFAPLTPGCYWVADYPGGTQDKCSLTTANQYWVNFPQTNEQAQIWQYQGTPDNDVARVLPS